MSREPNDPGNSIPSGNPAAPPAAEPPTTPAAATPGTTPGARSPARRPPGLRSAAGLAVIGSLGVFIVVILALIWVAADHMHPPPTPPDGPSDAAGQSNS